VTISRIPDRQATKSRIPYPNFGESRFLGSSQIPNPVKIFLVFPNPAPYFGQIPDPENTLPDPDVSISIADLTARFTMNRGKEHAQ